MKLTGAQALIKSLEQEAVEVIFGLPGGCILPAYDPLLESTIRMAWNELRHRAKLVKNFAKVPDIDANESRLGQVFLPALLLKKTAADLLFQTLHLLGHRRLRA